jgi:hypothetical protein
MAAPALNGRYPIRVANDNSYLSVFSRRPRVAAAPRRLSAYRWRSERYVPRGEPP